MSEEQALLDRFVKFSACNDMNDSEWADYARRIIDVAKAEMYDEIEARVKHEIRSTILAALAPATTAVVASPPREPARWRIRLDIYHPIDDGNEVISTLNVGEHDTEQDACKAAGRLNAILGAKFCFEVEEF